MGADVRVRVMGGPDRESLAAACGRDRALFERHFADQEAGKRTVLAAEREGALVGYLTKRLR
jgi:hypothetical protein